MTVTDVDAREARLRATALAASLPLAGTSEGRQRRWLTQLIVTERVIAAEAHRLGVSSDDAPTCAACCRTRPHGSRSAGDRRVLSDLLARRCTRTWLLT